MRGSSPLTRGKRITSRAGISLSRLIPAHAGKTMTQRDAEAVGEAHPRSRGENPSILGPNVASNGSSPLTRGKRNSPRRRHKRKRLIPAHAGKTHSAARASVSIPAHPRSRGENPDSCKPGASVPGSSPLTRGKPVYHMTGGTEARLIPAHAGKTGIRHRRRATRRAHPRSRGENFTLDPGCGQRIGSSPLTRGKRHP